VEYTDLPRGSYIFRVKAVDRDLNYSKAPVEVKVRIHPPYGWIALIGTLGLAVVGIVVTSGYAVKRKRERDRSQREFLTSQHALLQTQTQLMEAMERELQTAHDVQMGLLPQTAPSLPGFDIAGRCLPANHVGGDHYTYLWLDAEQTKLGIVIADVSGYEMQAAMTVMRFSEILRYETQGQTTPDAILTNLNRSVAGHLERRLYITACIGVLDAGERSLMVASAGHPPVYHRSGRTGRVVEVETSGAPLGVSQRAEYESVRVELEPGDVVVWYTDGIYEVVNREEEQYGFERLEGVLRGVGGEEHAEEVIERIFAEVEEFSGRLPHEDDMTVVVIRTV
jgi:sigma-B regulation protein RsbU (phosphoserine phosphatase)